MCEFIMHALVSIAQQHKSCVCKKGHGLEQKTFFYLSPSFLKAREDHFVDLAQNPNNLPSLLGLKLIDL